MFQEFLRFGLTLIYSLMWLFFSKIVSTSKGKLIVEIMNKGRSYLKGL